MAVKEPTGDLKKACWKGYTAVGMKNKNGRKVPNCVPVSEEECPVRRQYKELKKLSLGELRNQIKQSHRVIDVSGFDKESAISHILRSQHGHKRVNQAFGLDEASYDSLGLRSLHSANPQSQPDYAYKTQKGKVAAAKKNVPDLKAAIKSSLGKHPKPNLPEEVKQMDEAHKLNSPVEIIKGPRKGIKGHVGEIRQSYKGGPKTYTVYHGDHGAIQVGKEDIRAMKEETTGVQKHIVAVTLSDPSVKSADKIFKKIAVRASDKDEAKKRAIKFYRKAGYKVHDAYHHSVVTVLNKEEVEQQVNEVLDTISKRNTYLNAALTDAEKQASKARTFRDAPSTARDKASRKLAARNAGVKRVTKKIMTREEAEQMDEKHLTPAERKKREEIAQAMERKNPGMDMGKKMAIATAQAKKVAEGYGPKRYGSREHDWGDGPEPNSDKKFPYSGQNKSSWAHVHVNGEKVKEFHGPTSYDDASEHAHELAHQHKKAGQKHKIEIRDHSQPNTMIRVNETRNIIREVIKKKVDDQGTNQAKGKTATGEPMPKVQIDPVIDLGPTRG